MKYIDRNGKKIIHKSGQDRLLHILYTHTAGRLLLKPLVNPAFSQLAGRFLDSAPSRILIHSFIEKNNIKMSDYEVRNYTSFNDFFTRKIKPGTRIIAGDENTLISPCDSYVTAFPITEGCSLNIKDTEYTLRSLLHSRRLSERFQGGSALVFRLTVSDYHRYSYAVSGVRSKNYRIPGCLHTVNPVANDYYPIYKENTREYTVIHSPVFGDVLQMEVGALLVGKITNHTETAQVTRGTEKGYFEFGGSTIVLLLQKGAVSLRPDLFVNTENGFETQVHYGDSLGTANRHSV